LHQIPNGPVNLVKRFLSPNEVKFNTVKAYFLTAKTLFPDKQIIGVFDGNLLQLLIYVGWT